MRYVVFTCIWCAGSMLRTYGDMVEEGCNIAIYTRRNGDETILPIETAKTTDHKANLAARQQEERREGEVWFSPLMADRPGKHKDDTFVRTKYLTEFEAIVTGFTATTAEGHAFGAMEITDLDGKPLGSVVTGFTREEKQALCNRFAASGPFRVRIVSQGYTEARLAWHARFAGMVE